MGHAHPTRGPYTVLLRKHILSIVVMLFLVVIPVARVPFATGIQVVTSITVPIADPTPGSVVGFVSIVFRLLPTLVPIAVTLDAHAMIPVCVASLIGVSNSRRWENCNPSKAQGSQTR